VDLESRNELENLVSRHIVRGRLTVADFKLSASLKSLNGLRVPVKSERGETRYGGARIIGADIPCTNGVLHLLDGLAQAEVARIL
jgi:transforming growth factor-beta-induced protein